MHDGISLERVLSSPRLPTLPAVAIQVLELSSDVDVRLSDLADVIQNDQALASKVLRTVNSSYYGLIKPCPTIRRAIGYLGLNTVRTLALSFTLVETIDGGQDETDISFDFLTYWRRAVYSASGARRMARMTGECEPEEAFLAALLQDVGMVALYRAEGEKYLQAIDLAGEDHRQLPEIEQRAFHLSHDVVGAKLAKLWRLPKEHITAIRFSHQSELAPPQLRGFARIVESATLAALVLSTDTPGAMLDDFFESMQMRYSIDREMATDLLADLAQDAADLSRVLQLDTGRHIEVPELLEEAETALVRLQIEQADRSEADSPPRHDTIDRAAFNRVTADAFNKAGLSGAPVSIVFLGPDNIDALNQQEGHGAGDAAIAALEGAIRQALPEHVISRYVAAQFAVLLPGENRSQALDRTRSLQRAVAQLGIPVDKPQSGESLCLTISAGIATFDPTSASGESSWSHLLRGAAAALYAARQAGASEIRCFSDASPPEATHRAA